MQSRQTLDHDSLADDRLHAASQRAAVRIDVAQYVCARPAGGPPHPALAPQVTDQMRAVTSLSWLSRKFSDSCRASVVNQSFCSCRCLAFICSNDVIYCFHQLIFCRCVYSGCMILLQNSSPEHSSNHYC